MSKYFACVKAVLINFVWEDPNDLPKSVGQWVDASDVQDAAEQHIKDRSLGSMVFVGDHCYAMIMVFDATKKKWHEVYAKTTFVATSEVISVEEWKGDD